MSSPYRQPAEVPSVRAFRDLDLESDLDELFHVPEPFGPSITGKPIREIHVEFPGRLPDRWPRLRMSVPGLPQAPGIFNRGW